MILRLQGNFISCALLISLGLSLTSGFNFPDFNLYDESSDTLDKACSLFHSMIEYINYTVPKIEEVSFQMRTACQRIEFSVIEADLLRYWENFNENLKTVVIVTGWNSHLNEAYTEELTRAYLCRGGVNLIVVDTKDFIRTEYIKAAYNTQKIGEFVAEGLKNLKIPGKDLHLIGHSLGSHIMGSAGRHFTNITGGDRIARITGLDPARPCFRTDQPIFPRLGTADAEFVDIIHTNPNESGLEEEIGHIDFYPGGLHPQQVNCPIYNLKCSHIRSIDYYIETVFPGNENNFIASACGNFTDLQAKECNGLPKVPMGINVDKNARGLYYLAVNEKVPYGKNAQNLKYLEDFEQCGTCNDRK